MLGCRALPSQDAPLEASLDGVVTLVRGEERKCVGVLVAPSAVLTAAHCSRRNPDLDVLWRRNGDTQRAEVAGVQTHPTLDVALLHLTQAIPLRPWALATSDADSMTPGTAARVALLPSGPDAPGTTRAAPLPATVTQVGRDVVAEYGGEPGPCGGDSGSPLAPPQGELAVAGVLRGGARGCRGPDRFVPASAFAPWLRERVAGAALSAAGTPPPGPSADDSHASIAPRSPAAGSPLP